MQINIFDKRIFEGFKWLGWVATFFLLWLKGCNLNPEKVTTTEIKGSFPTKTEIQHIPLTPKNINKVVCVQKSGENDRQIEKLKSEIQNYQNEADFMLDEFTYKMDSLQQIIAYQKAIQLSRFYAKFDDNNLHLEISGIVQGQVKEITPNYTIKSQTLNIPETKQVKFRLLGGVGVSNNTQFNKPLFNAGVGFQNAKGNILFGTFDTEQRIGVVYYQSIFAVKK